MKNGGFGDWFARHLVGRSPEFESVINAARIISSLDVPVLLLGENGTGKELFAQAIHANSPRSSHHIATVNCAALPENLFESELFGFKKGSFTNAERDYSGKIRAAHNGTLFLDEIAELSPACQAKLLRFLESSECQSIGQENSDIVNVRVIAATNQDLPSLINCGKFRKDLYYRLNVVPIEIPPLRDRHNDVPDLIHHFTHLLAQRHNVKPPVFNKQALKRLTQYHWPGNVRELRNLCERLVIFNAGMTVTPSLLPKEICDPANTIQNNVFQSFLDESMSLNQFEKIIISSALEKTQGNQSQAAKLLGITRDTLLYRVKKYDISLLQ